MSIIRKIKDYYKNDSKSKILFTTPSHGQGRFIPPLVEKILGKTYYKADFSEIEGFDNLACPEGIIKDIQNNLSKIYKSKITFLLTNGSSSGILASLLSVLSENDIVLVARNSHISLCNALVLTGAKPEWILPQYNNFWNVYEQVIPDEIEKKLKENNKIKAVFVTSPTYEGVYSNIAEISKICKKYGVLLIVDEAHGALINFSKFESLPAIQCGADISIQSLHKTAGAPNPCALLHISQSSEIDPDLIQKSLNLISTTSPSYPIMAAIEGTVDYLSSTVGSKDIKKLLINIENFKRKLNNKIYLYNSFSDPTKLLIKIEGISGYSAAEILNKNFKIEEEFSNDSAMLFITGIGTSEKMLNKLAKSLNKISEANKIVLDDTNKDKFFQYNIPSIAMTPREAYMKSNTKCNISSLKIEDAIGKISANTLCAYPPGIPIIVQGEVINEQTVYLVQRFLNREFVDVIV